MTWVQEPFAAAEVLWSLKEGEGKMELNFEVTVSLTFDVVSL